MSTDWNHPEPRLRRKQGGCGVILAYTIIGDEVAGSLWIPGRAKMIAQTYIDLLKAHVEI